MAPKKGRASSSRAPRAIPPVEGFESVEFETESQRIRFLEQSEREVKPSRFVCQLTLTMFWIHDIMRDIFLRC
ncbi:unnamed protein product, partial [Cuscuta europaea]